MTRMSYDESTDSLYLTVRDLPSRLTIEVEEDVMVDLGEDGEIVGFDIQHASAKPHLVERLKRGEAVYDLSAHRRPARRLG